MSVALPLNRLGLQPTAEILAVAGAVARTTTALGIGGVYTSGWLEVSAYEEIRLRSLSNQASAAGGVVIDWSFDGATVAASEAAGTALAATLYDSGALARRFNYVRVTYTNGAAAQATFRCELSAYQTRSP